MFFKNLNALNIQNPDLVKRLKEFSLEDAQKKVSVLNAQSEDLIIAYENHPLDDMKNPLEKTKSIWGSVVKDPLKKTDIVVVFGLGLGYLFKRAYVSTGSKVVVYEPKIEVFRFVLEYVDFSEQLLDKRVYFTDKESDCSKYLSEKYMTNDRIEIVYSEIYLNLFSDVLLSLSKKIIQICESKKADISTIKKLSKAWATNSIENMKFMPSSRPLSLLKGLFQGKTAMVLGAGPSLKSNLEVIKQNREKYVIFAVNKVLDYAIENGIIPDFLVAADAMWLKYTMNVIPDIFKKINLISTTKADSFIYSQNFRSIFNYYLKNDVFYEEVSAKFPQEITLYETEGTAVSQCYYSALEMGFSSVIFCGLDLAIKDNEAYAPDIKMVNKTGTTAMFSLQTKGLVEVKSVTGEMVQTRDDYSMFVSQLEDAFAENTSIKLYNTSDFGAYIEGMIYKSLDDIVKIIEPIKVDFNSMIEDLRLSSEDKWKEICNFQSEMLKKQQSDMHSIKLKIENWIEENNDKLEQKTVEELEKVKYAEISIIKQVLNNTILGLYFQSEILEYSQLNSENVESIKLRLYALDLFEKIAQIIPSLDSCINYSNL